MSKRIQSMVVSKLPDEKCPACRGIGAIRMTAHFMSGDYEYEWPCWQCFGDEVKLKLPTTDNR
jgi:DnaJ-class molecular chaperone